MMGAIDNKDRTMRRRAICVLIDDKIASSPAMLEGDGNPTPDGNSHRGS